MKKKLFITSSIKGVIISLVRIRMRRYPFKYTEISKKMIHITVNLFK